MNIYSIYRIVNLTNQKTYIGWTSRDPKVRFKEHLNGNPKEMVIAAAVEKYGKDNFCLEIVYQTLDYDHSREIEGFFINQCNSLTESEGGWGYNIDLGGKGHKRSKITIEKHRQKITGRKQSEEHKRKRADAIRGEKNGMHCIGEKHPWFGRSHTDESKQKISNSQKTRIEKQKTDGTYIKPNVGEEGFRKMAETVRAKAASGKSLKYKNIVIEDINDNVINLPIHYSEYFKSMKLNNFMSKCIKDPNCRIKGFKLLSYELNE